MRRLYTTTIRSAMSYYPPPPRAWPVRDGRLRDDPVDVHEVMKREALAPLALRACGVRDIYVVLDSYLAARRDPRRGEYEFSFGIGQQAGPDKIGVRESISNLFEIEVEAFCAGVPPLIAIDEAEAGVPFADGAAEQNGITRTPNPNAANPRNNDPVVGQASQLAHCPRVTAEFTDIGVQAFSGFKSRRHHFEFAASLVGDGTDRSAVMHLEPVERKYILTEPLHDLHGLRLRLYSPDEPLNLPPSVVDNVQLYVLDEGGANLRLHVVGPEYEGDGRTRLDFAALLTPGDRVFLDNVDFAPMVAVPQAHVLAQFLNRGAGHLVGDFGLAAPGAGPAVLTTNTRFQLDPTITLVGVGGEALLAQAPGAKPVRLRIAKNRIRMPVRFRTTIDRYTQGLTL